MSRQEREDLEEFEALIEENDFDTFKSWVEFWGSRMEPLVAGITATVLKYKQQGKDRRYMLRYLYTRPGLNPHVPGLAQSTINNRAINVLSRDEDEVELLQIIVASPFTTNDIIRNALYWGSVYRTPNTDLYLCQFLHFGTAHGGHGLSFTTYVLPYKDYLNARFTAKFKEFFYATTRALYTEFKQNKSLNRGGSNAGQGRILVYDVVLNDAKNKLKTWWQELYKEDERNFDERYEEAVRAFGLKVFDRATTNPFPATNNKFAHRAWVYSIGTPYEVQMETVDEGQMLLMPPTKRQRTQAILWPTSTISAQNDDDDDDVEWSD